MLPPARLSGSLDEARDRALSSAARFTAGPGLRPTAYLAARVQPAGARRLAGALRPEGASRGRATACLLAEARPRPLPRRWERDARQRRVHGKAVPRRRRCEPG